MAQCIPYSKIELICLKSKVIKAVSRSNRAKVVSATVRVEFAVVFYDAYSAINDKFSGLTWVK